MFSLRSVRRLCINAAIFSACLLAGPVSIHLSRATARISPPSAAAGSSDLILHASGSEADLASISGMPQIEDVTSQDSNAPVVVFQRGGIVLLQTGTSGQRFWRIPLRVEKLTATGTFTRTLKVSMGSYAAVLDFSVSNTAPPPFDIKLGGIPPEWNAAESRCLRIRVSASGSRATGIALTSTLTDTSTKKGLSSQLFLSQDGTTEAAGIQLETAVNDTGQPLFVCIVDNFQASGVFSGNVAVSANEKPDGAVVALTIYHRTSRAVTLGTALVALGCLLALGFRFLLPAQRASNQAELPAALLRDRLASTIRVHANRSSTAIPTQQIAKALDGVENALQRNVLIARNFIPSGLAALFRSVDTAGYKAFLEDQSRQIQVLQILVADGVSRVDLLDPKSQPVKDAMAEIDAIASRTPLPDVDTTRRLVQEVLDKIPRMSGEPLAVKNRTAENIIFLIDASGYFSLLAWVVIGFLSGYLVVVLSNPGFGKPSDFLYCLLWGFGVSTANPISSNPAQTVLGIKIPESLS